MVSLPFNDCMCSEKLITAFVVEHHHKITTQSLPGELLVQPSVELNIRGHDINTFGRTKTQDSNIYDDCLIGLADGTLVCYSLAFGSMLSAPMSLPIYSSTYVPLPPAAVRMTISLETSVVVGEISVQRCSSETKIAQKADTASIIL